jgi:hypothetical protein
MEIRFTVLWEIEIDDNVHRLDIDTAGKEIC